MSMSAVTPSGWTIGSIALIGALTFAPLTHAQTVEPPEQRLTFITQEWSGERFPGGRPKVPDDVLERMKNVSLEQAWEELQKHGYNNQFAGDWKIIHPDRRIVGRALTAQYMPSSPSLERRMTEAGHKAGRVGNMNSWPIDMLEKGDVYIADGFGKVKDGTLIGGNLGTAIYTNSGNGVIFDGSVRDLDELKDIEGFNAFVRGWHPSFIQEMMLMGVNVPIRIGEAIVLPGDVVLAEREGVLFIPAHLAETIVGDAELVLLRDTFFKQRLDEKKYAPGQVDVTWDKVAKDIKDDFRSWLGQNKENLPVPAARIQAIIETQGG